MNLITTPGSKTGLSKSTIIWGVVAFFVFIIFVGGCSSYNTMVTNEETVNQTWGDVQASYQRRFDLIPNLVSTVKGYAAHEKSTLTETTAMRAGAMTADDLAKLGDELNAAKAALGGFNGPDSKGPDLSAMEALNSKMNLYINAVHEAYPNLKAAENFLDLQKQLESTENRINTERNKYNQAVMGYNVSIRTFPRSIFARMFGFTTKEQFAATSEAQSAPSVDFEN